jgi:hypothetical protein
MSNINDSSSTLPSHLPNSLSRAEWLSLLRADQQRRWRHGERVLVEDYLTRWPTLAEDVEGLLDLVYGEALLREESGESVTLDEYVRRFPAHEASLKRQFDLHRALAAGSILEAATSGNGTTPPTRPPSDWTKPPVHPAPADASPGISSRGEGDTRKGPHRKESAREQFSSALQATPSPAWKGKLLH